MKLNATAALNKYKAEWTTRYEVNSTVRKLNEKLVILRKTRIKELRNSKNDTESAKIHSRYDDEIKFIDYLLYLINLDYYEIMGKLKR